MGINGMNLYFLYAYGINGEKHQLKALSGKTIPFFKEGWHNKHQVLYLWHSSGGKAVASDFEYLYRLRNEFGDKVDFWFVNLTGVDDEEIINVKTFTESHNLESDSILLDMDEEVAATLRIKYFSVITFIKKDNYVYRKIEGEFDENLVRETISSMMKAPLHYDYE